MGRCTSTGWGQSLIIRPLFDFLPCSTKARRPAIWILEVSRQAPSSLVNGKVYLSVEIVLRLSRAFGSTPETWIGMQTAYDLWQAFERSKENRVERFALPSSM